MASARVAAPTGPPTATFQAATGSTTDTNSYTFTSQPIGTASSTRRVVVAVASRNAGISVSTLTIGGVSASRDVVRAASGQFAEIWSAVVNSGTTANIVVTMSGTASYCGIGIWSLTSGAPTGQTGLAPTNVGTLSMSVTTAVGDVVIGVAAFRTSTSGARAAWNTATERYDADVDTNIRKHTGAEVVATGTSTDMGVVITNFSTDSAACSAAYR